MANVNMFEIENLKQKLYYHVSVAGLPSVMNEFYKERISPAEIPDTYIFDEDYLNQDVKVGDDGSVVITSTVRYYNNADNDEFYVDFIYSEVGDKNKTMQIKIRSFRNSLTGPTLDYNKYMRKYQKIANKLADQLDL